MASYKFGEFLLDPGSRVLLRNGKPIVVTGKAWDTLEMLVQNQGRVLSKDELLTRLWPGTVVEEANLTQAVFTLRKLLGDNSRSPCYIVTVPSRGYQFVAPVQEMATPADPKATSAAAPSPINKSRKRVALGIGSFAAGAALLLASLWVLTGRRSTVQNPIANPFTATLGQADMPAFSPDGKEIAYQLRSEEGKQQSIYVKLIGTEDELRLTNSAGEDFCPRWSPDGRYIAFLRMGNGSSGYFIVSALGGPVRQVLQTKWDKYTRFDCLAAGPGVVSGRQAPGCGANSQCPGSGHRNDRQYRVA